MSTENEPAAPLDSPRHRSPRPASTLSKLAWAGAAVFGLATAGFVVSAAASPPARSASRANRLAARVGALEAAQRTEHRRRDFNIWQNRTAIRRLIDATASPKKRGPKLGPVSTPSATKDRACCFPPKTSFLVCDDVHPIECTKRGGTLAPGQSAFTAVQCGAGVCGIESADQSASGWDELFGNGGAVPRRPN